MEGPRAVREEDMPSLRAMTDLAMHNGLVDEYPQLFNRENYQNVRVCLDGGHCVSHVGMTERHAALFGCLIQACCVGGVCTHPDYRERGLASACFDDALRKARADGVDVMIVSGDRSLYRMRGCVRVGDDRFFAVACDAMPPALAEMGAGMTVEPMREDELADVQECYRSEPVRFLRPPADYDLALRCRWIMGRLSDVLVVRENGSFRGYVIARQPDADGSAVLAEFAGDRRSVVASLPHVVRRYGPAVLRLHVMRHDRLLRALCEQVGLPGEARTTPGTVIIVNFPQFMERMRARFNELVGVHTATRLTFLQEGARFVFALGDEAFGLDQAAATELIFGTVGGARAEAQVPDGPLGAALRAMLPLPTLWYGINYA